MSAYTFGIQGQFEIRSILWTQSSPGPYPQQVPTLPGQVALQRPGHAWWYSLSVVRTHCTPEVRVSGTGGCSHPPRRIEILPASPAVPVPSWGQPRTPGRYLNVGVLLSQTLVGQDLGNGSALPPCGKRQDRSMTSVTQQLGLMSYIWYSTPHQEAQTGLTATDPGSSSECIRMVTPAPAQLDTSTLCTAVWRYPPMCVLGPFYIWATAHTWLLACQLSEATCAAYAFWFVSP